jgi:hypothetical protein
LSYIASADFRERTVKPYCANLILSENDGLDAYIDLIITQVTARVELDLNDDFEPAGGDPDETIEVDSRGDRRLYTPRRVRALTTVSTRYPRVADFTVQASTAYRLRKSLNAAGTAMADGQKLDWLDAMPGLTSGIWPSGAGTVQLVGKFGWAAVPDDIKRLVALKTYDLVKSQGDPLSRIVQRTTADAVLTYGPSQEVADISDRYRRSRLAFTG